MQEKRIINLEIKFSHQDQLLDDLNKIVTAQQLTIERLEREILDLKRSVNTESGAPGSRTLADDKPPHY